MGENESTPMEVLDSYVSALVRNKWWFLLAFPIVTVLALLGAQLIPKKFTSEATLVVNQQKVLEQYVVAGDSTSAADAILKMKRTVLSHTRLLKIIEDLGLLEKDRGNSRPEDLTAAMRDAIDVEPIDEIGRLRGRDDFAAFTISFSASKPELAQAAVLRVTQLFIDQDRQNRSQQTSNTSDFVKSGLDAAERRVQEQERRLAAARAGNANVDRQRVSMATEVAELRSQLTTVQGTLSRVQQQRFALESSGITNLATLQGERDALLGKYTRQHAEVVRKEQQIARLQALLAQLRSGSSAGSSLAGQDDPVTAQMRTQVTALLAENDQAAQEEKRLRNDLAGAQAAQAAGGYSGQDVAEIQRDLEVYKKTYTDLMLKQQQVQQVVALNDGQESGQFRLIDVPTLPTEPSSPKLMMVNLGAAGFGLVVALVLALFMDLRQGGLHTEKEISALAQVPLVLSIPVIHTLAEEKALGRQRVLSWVAAFVAVVSVAAIEYYAFHKI